MKRKISIIFLSLLSFFNAFCENSSSNPPVDSVYANLQITKRLLDIQKGTYYDWIVSASFFATNSTTNMPVSDVKFGNSSLKYDLHYKGNYFDTTGVLPDTLRAWAVIGNNSIPDFTYTPTNPMPLYIGYDLIEDTMTLVNGVSIPISGIMDATNITVVVSDGQNEVLESIEINTSNTRLTSNAIYSSGVLSISATDLGSLATTTDGYIEVIISNVDYQTFNGKRIAFSRSFMYKKDKVVFQ